MIFAKRLCIVKDCANTVANSLSVPTLAMNVFTERIQNQKFSIIVFVGYADTMRTRTVNFDELLLTKMNQFSYKKTDPALPLGGFECCGS